jgi:hypothetical protein
LNCVNHRFNSQQWVTFCERREISVQLHSIKDFRFVFDPE